MFPISCTCCDTTFHHWLRVASYRTPAMHL